MEAKLVALLRDRAEKAIEVRGLTWAAERLDISVPGVKALLWDYTWGVDKAIRVAGCLGVLTDADLDRLAGQDAVAS